jgi:hypothetical protein
MKRFVEIFVAVLILVMLIGGSLWYVYGDSEEFKEWRRYRLFKDKPFDSATWREGGPKERALMAWSMMRRHGPMWCDRKQTIELLGEPDVRRTRPDGEYWYYALDYSDRPSRPQWVALLLHFGDEYCPDYLGLVYNCERDFQTPDTYLFEEVPMTGGPSGLSPTGVSVGQQWTER